MVGYICYHRKETWGNVNGGRAESMCRLTHVTVPLLGASDKIECMPLTKLAR